MLNEELRIGIADRSTEFEVRIIKMANFLPKTPAGFAISSQIIRSATSIGANLQEAKSAASKKEFIHCVHISLKDARETLYWLTIISNSELLTKEKVSLLLKENDEIIRILFSIIKNTKSNLRS